MHYSLLCLRLPYVCSTFHFSRRTLQGFCLFACSPLRFCLFGVLLCTSHLKKNSKAMIAIWTVCIASLMFALLCTQSPVPEWCAILVQSSHVYSQCGCGCHVNVRQMVSHGGHLPMRADTPPLLWTDNGLYQAKTSNPDLFNPPCAYKGEGEAGTTPWKSVLGVLTAIWSSAESDLLPMWKVHPVLYAL